VGFAFTFGEPLPVGVRRIAREQLDGAMLGLADPSTRGIEATVHDARKRCKKVRGLARLVRGAIGPSAFDYVNKPLREAAAELSPMRDAHAILATFDRLLASHKLVGFGGDFDAVRSELQRRADEASPDVADGAARIVRAIQLVWRARDASQEWRLHDRRVLERGLTRIYGRGRRAMVASRFDGNVESRHEWRKREKDLWYATRLLVDAAPSVLTGLQARLDELAEALGDDHDLAVLSELLRSQPDAFGGPEADRAAALADSTAGDLQSRAYRLGATLYAEKPTTYGRRVGGYWRLWHDLGPERQVGAIDVLNGASEPSVERSVDAA
jgi:CHAD domain-containing protein